MALEIRELSACRDAIPVLTKWFQSEWGYLGGSSEETTSRLIGTLSSDELPTTLVGLVGSDVVATATLKLREMTIRPQYKHWIGSVYVSPEHRRCGYGSSIVTETVCKAVELGIKTLYLQTTDRQIM